jgi:hypothetical protein
VTVLSLTEKTSVFAFFSWESKKSHYKCHCCNFFHSRLGLYILKYYYSFLLNEDTCSALSLLLHNCELFPLVNLLLTKRLRVAQLNFLLIERTSKTNKVNFYRSRQQYYKK